MADRREQTVGIRTFAALTAPVLLAVGALLVGPAAAQTWDEWRHSPPATLNLNPTPEQFLIGGLALATMITERCPVYEIDPRVEVFYIESVGPRLTDFAEGGRLYQPFLDALTRLPAYLFELKLDGFRGLADTIQGRRRRECVADSSAISEMDSDVHSWAD